MWFVRLVMERESYRAANIAADREPAGAPVPAQRAPSGRTQKGAIMTIYTPRWLRERLAPPRIGRRVRRCGIALLVFLSCGTMAGGALAIDTARATAASCIGDCNDDGRVTVDELVKGVNIALDSLSVDQCPRFDCRRTGQVAIDCLIQAVSAAQNGCTAEPTISPTFTPMASDTPTPVATSPEPSTFTHTPTATT